MAPEIFLILYKPAIYPTLLISIGKTVIIYLSFFNINEDLKMFHSSKVITWNPKS